jgi:hypothetical protein
VVAPHARAKRASRPCTAVGVPTTFTKTRVYLKCTLRETEAQPKGYEYVSRGNGMLLRACCVRADSGLGANVDVQVEEVDGEAIRHVVVVVPLHRLRHVHAQPLLHKARDLALRQPVL